MRMWFIVVVIFICLLGASAGGDDYDPDAMP